MSVKMLILALILSMQSLIAYASAYNMLGCFSRVTVIPILSLLNHTPAQTHSSVAVYVITPSLPLSLSLISSLYPFSNLKVDS